MKDEQLSANFTLNEMCASITAKTLGIDNTPTANDVNNLRILCKEILQPTRDEWGKPMHINSGFRSADLNKAVGGKPNSYHLRGCAADIAVTSNTEGYALAAHLLKQKLTDLAILEKHKQRFWVHVQWSYAPRHKFTTINVA